ncbi:MAG: hypothetical protein AAGA32_00460 [Pseudomonadota bacterium]
MISVVGPKRPAPAPGDGAAVWSLWRRKRVLDSGLVREAWAGYEPEVDVARIVLADDGFAALLKLIDGGRGVVWSAGGHIRCRRLEGVRVEPLGPALTLRFPGWLSLRLRLPFADLRAQADWIDPA